jgi:dGTPase
MTPEALEALEALRKDMFENMYLIPEVRGEFEKAQKILAALFEYVVAHPEEYLDTTGDEPVERLALDFIAGMTDRYALNLYAKLFLPKPWVS